MKEHRSDPRAEEHPAGRQRPAASAVVALGVGLLATLGLFAQVRSWEQKRLQADLEMVARSRVATIQANVSACLETLYALRELYAASTSVERHEFHAAVAENRPRRPEIRSLRWVARVPPEEVADFEAAARKDNAPEFSIRELRADGEPAPLGLRQEHLPVVFFEPATNVAPMVGLDLAADLSLVIALRRACENDQPVSLPRTGLAALEIKADDVVMALPVFRNGLAHDTADERRTNLQGFVVGVFDLPTIVAEALKTLPAAGAHFAIHDDATRGTPGPLYLDRSRVAQDAGDTPEAALAQSSLQFQDELAVAGSRWPIRFAASERFLTSHRVWGSWILLAGGCLLSGVVAGYVCTLRTRTARIQQTVRERTAELQASEERLRRSEQQVADLINHVDGIVWEVDARTLTFTFVSQRAERLLGYPLRQWLDEPTFWQDHLHPEDREATVSHCLDATRRGEPHDFEYRMIAADGREIWLRDLVTLELKNGQAVRMRGIMVDITSRKQAEAEAAARVQQLKHLSELSLLLAGEPGAVFERAARLIREMFKVRAVCLCELEGRELIFRTVDVDGAVFSDAGRCPLAATPCECVEAARDICVYERVQELFPEASFLKEHGANAYCGFPSLDAQGRVVAITCLLDDQPRTFSEEDQHILRLIGQRIAVERDHARHHAERKLADAKLRERDALLQKLSEHVPGVIYQYQLFPDGRSCFPYASEGIREIYEVTPEEVRESAEAVFRRLHPEDFDAVVASINRSVETMEPWSFVYRVRLAFRGIRWLEGYSVPDRLPDGSILWHGYIRDVTDRKQSEAALRLSEERLRACIGNTPNVAVQWYDEQGRVLFWNPASERIFGWKSEEAKGRTLDQLIHTPEEAAAFVEILAEMRVTGQPVGPAEFEFGRRDGSRGTCLSTIFAIPGFDGQSCFVCMDVDVTERKRAEDELRRNEAELRVAKEAAEVASRAKSEFLATMSHEIRTPMNGVIGFTNLLLDTPLTKEQQEFAGTIKSSGEALLTLVNDILDFSKIEAGKLAVEHIRYDLAQAVEDVADLLAAGTGEKQVELAIRFAPGVPRQLSGDPGRVRQVLLNLMSNALKFTERGHVFVDVQPAPGVTGQLRISIADTGIGIPRHKQDQLFQHFTQADSSNTRRFGGSGLGLAISRRLVELMGGQIGFESEPGAGSTFWFTLPAPPNATQPLPKEEPGSLGEARVLVVDDHEINRRLLHEQFKVWNVDHECASSGVEALEKLRSAHAANRPFQVAVLDYLMPEMDGKELGRIIKEDPSLKTTALVMLTSGSQRAEARQFLDAGFAAFLLKPLIRPSQLLDALVTALSPSQANSRSAETVGMDDVPARSGGPSVPPPSPTPLFRVLLAEDNATNQRLAMRLLEKLQCRVDVAANGREAVALAAQLPYDAIFMDCHMPEMDGLAATAEIRRQEVAGRSRATPGPHRVPIIALTANAMQGDRDICLAAGMDDYLAKPIQQVELRRVLERWLRHSEVAP
jgi:PAS domain S-box-containing protein